MSYNNEYWKKRIDNINSGVRLRSLIDYFNIDCQSEGEITQVHCPFHGYDAHASARIYESNSMYCWVCNNNWDVIAFIKDFKNIKFKDAIIFLEDMYSIQKPSLEESIKEPSFEEYLKQEENIVGEKDYSKEFSNLSKMLKRSRDNLDLSTYRRLFYALDTLYANYKIKDFSHGLSLESSLKNLHREISEIS